uniref:Uncharacterized protein n=1 Tax=Anguilla anguilla TaxID=7936 RepID=A0A0E9TLZ9_ANGAN
MCAVQTVNALGGKLTSNTDKHNSFLTVILKENYILTRCYLSLLILAKKFTTCVHIFMAAAEAQ